MKNKLMDQKELQAGLKANKLKRSKMLMVNSVVILFRLKLDKFYSIGVMN